MKLIKHAIFNWISYISSANFSAALRNIATNTSSKMAGTLGVSAVRNASPRGPTVVQVMNGRFVGPNGTPKSGFVAAKIAQYESLRN